MIARIEQLLLQNRELALVYAKEAALGLGKTGLLSHGFLVVVKQQFFTNRPADVDSAQNLVRAFRCHDIVEVRILLFISGWH